MKAVILAGARGTRLAEETNIKPKQLFETNGQPLIWHIMQNHAQHGVTKFIVLAGYKGQQIREYFANFWSHQTDVTFDFSAPDREIHEVRSLPWKVTVLDNGIDTNTGGRIAKLKNLIDQDFLLTYGNGVSDVNIQKLIQAHKDSGNFMTLAAVQPPARFGVFGKKVVQEIIPSQIPESNWLALDSSMAYDELKRKCSFSQVSAVNQTANRYSKFANGEDARELMKTEISRFKVSKW